MSTVYQKWCFFRKSIGAEFFFSLLLSQGSKSVFFFLLPLEWNMLKSIVALYFSGKKSS